MTKPTKEELKELLKQFPKKLYADGYNHKVCEYNVKEVQVLNSHCLEVNLGQGDYLYCQFRPQSIWNIKNWGIIRTGGNLYYYDKAEAERVAKLQKEEEDNKLIRDRVWQAYKYAMATGGKLVYDFSGKKA